MTHDEELQRKIENGEPAENTVDARIYKKIMESLQQEPFQLPSGFADNVVRRATSPSHFMRDYFWMSIGLICFLIAGIITAFALKVTLNFGSFKFISGYSGLIVFGILFVLAFQWIDKNIIQKSLRTHS